jgi:hypothetical protein
MPLTSRIETGLGDPKFGEHLVSKRALSGPHQRVAIQVGSDSFEMAAEMAEKVLSRVTVSRDL